MKPRVGKTSSTKTWKRFEKKGAAAHRSGISKDASPYKTDKEPHTHKSWVGGWAESALGLRNV